MMGHLVDLADVLLWAWVQWPLLLLALAGRWLDRVSMRGYRRIVVLRRRMKGQPLWQPHDRLIGMEPPEDPPCECGSCRDRRFLCPACGRRVPWCKGASDDYPDLCDDCANAAARKGDRR